MLYTPETVGIGRSTTSELETKNCLRYKLLNIKVQRIIIFIKDQSANIRFEKIVIFVDFNV